jgi:hypothetical protein
MFLDQPTDRLQIKPIVVPRKVTRDDKSTWLEFFVVFSFQRKIADSSTPPVAGDPPHPLSIPGCLKKNWPSFILSCLRGTQPAFETNFVLFENGGRIPCGGVEIRTPEDLKAEGWDWTKSETIGEANRLWQAIITPSVKDNSPPPSVGPKIGFGLAGVYKTGKPVNTNPNAATDLRPGFRLESVDHRDLAEAFHSAEATLDKSAQPPSEPLGPKKQAPPIDDLRGIHIVLQLGYYSQAKLAQFQLFLTRGKDKQSQELAAFVRQIWEMYGRATDVAPGKAAAGPPSIEGELRMSISDRDPKFNDSLRNQMQQNPKFRDAVAAVATAYGEFVLQVGQTELRRHGRFTDSSRHRVPGDPSQPAGSSVAGSRAGQHRDGSRIFRTASATTDLTANRQPPQCEFLLAQLRQHPGIMRRLALSIPCRVKIDPNLVGDSSFAGTAQILFTSKLPQTAESAAIEDCTDRDFFSPQTVCEFELDGSKPYQFFRATPHETISFFGVSPDGSTGHIDNWRKLHLLPTSLFTVSQDDLSIAAARADAGITTIAGEDENHQVRTRINSLAIYANPVDASGGAISIADALDGQLNKSSELAARADAAAERWIAQLKARDSQFRLAGHNAATLDVPAVVPDYEEHLYAEQLMQGYTVFVRDMDRNGRPGPWQSLCRRMVAAIAVADNPAPTVVAPRAAQPALSRNPALPGSKSVPGIKSAMSCCPAHAPPAGDQIICRFEEEGCISTSITTAARPYVGQACDVPSAQGDFDLKVLTIKNEVDFRAICHWGDTPPSGTANPDSLPVLGGIFRPRMTWSDFQSGDMVIVTPRGGTPGKGQQPESLDEIVATEVLVCPVFYSDNGVAPPLDSAESDIRLINAISRPDLAKPDEASRNNERFPIAVTRHGTRFVDAFGATDLLDAELSGPKQFTVEGERRYYAQQWWSQGGDIKTFVAVDPVPASQIQPSVPPNPHVPNVPPLSPSGQPPKGVLSYLGSAETLSYIHIDPNVDFVRSLSVPLTWVIDPAAGPATGSLGGLPVEALNTVWWLDSSTSPKSGSLLENHPGEDIVASGSGSNATSSATVNSKPTLTPKLQVVRGFVTKVECQLVIAQDKSTDSPDFVKLAGSYKLNFTVPPLPQDPPPDAVAYLTTIRGAITTSEDAVSFIVTPTVKPSITQKSMSQSGCADPTVIWILTVRTTAGATATVVYSENALAKIQLSPDHKKRFVYPEATLNYLIEAVGVAGPQDLAGRGLPQHPFGTFYSTGDSNYDLYFDDGTLQALSDVKAPNSLDSQPVRAKIQSTDGQSNTVTTIDSSDSPGMLVAGELTAVSSSDKEMLFEITDLDRRVWTIHEPINSGAMLQPSSDSLPPRRLADLEVGEFLLARCLTVKKSSTGAAQQTRHVSIFRDGKGLKASICLLGTLEIQKDVTAGMITAEGTDKYRVVGLNTPITTASPDGIARTVARIELWCDKVTLNGAPLGQMVTLPALRVIFAETVSLFAEPKPLAPGQTADLATRPLHAAVSEMIARWSGWSLSTASPGRTDGDDAKASDQHLTLQFKNYRPNLSDAACLPSARREGWKLPPLRFGRHYQVCLRRVDLAGNHLYDEVLPSPTELDKIKGYNVITSLYDATVLQRAENAARAQGRATSANPEPLGKPFLPASLPSPPLLGFTQDRRTPAYIVNKNGQKPKAAPVATVDSSTPSGALVPVSFGRHGRQWGSTPVQKLPAVKRPPAPLVVEDSSGFPIVAWDRDQTLFVLSDVLDLMLSSSADTSAHLLPAPAPVETVLLSGKLDNKSAEEAVKIIRRHERYLDDRCNFFGLDKNNELNYFGDWDSREFSVQLTSDSCEIGDPIPCDQKQFTFFDGTWPKPLGVRLKLAPGAPRHTLSRTGLAASAYQLSSKGTTSVQSQITARLPPGVEAELQIVAKGRKDVWKPIQLIHATNGACVRPIWQALDEVLPAPNTPASTNRQFLGLMQLDIASSGSFTIQAYWNEPGDEAVPIQYAPAEAIAHVEDGKVTGIEVTDPGFGFTTRAVALVLPPMRLPELRAIVKHGQVVDVEIVDAGEDCRYDLAYRVAPVDENLGQQVKSARVVARVNGQGQVATVEIVKDHSGQSLPGNCRLIPCIPTPPVLEASCKGGLVDRLIVHDPGGGYESDLRIRVIRQPPLARSAEACVGLRSERGELCRIDVTERGGWYATPPTVVAFDLGGDGCGAKLVAVLDSAGGVAAVNIASRGIKYSSNVRIGFYTNVHQTPDQAIPAASRNQRQDLCNVTFQHAMRGLHSRRVDYVVQLNSRFQNFLNNPTLPTALDFWTSGRQLETHVPRWSPPRQIELTSFVRPVKPDVAYLMPAFEWQIVGRQEASVDEARSFFLTNSKGRLCVRRQPLIRVYLQRPWHFSGLEQLGVVVMPALINTIRLPKPDDKLTLIQNDTSSTQFKPPDGQAAGSELLYFNEPSYANEPLEPYVMPANMRNFVTRWGSDPVWNEAAFPPLTPDNFTSRLPGISYERIDLSDVAVDPNTPPQLSDRPAYLALHEVHYDGAKERWYADLRLKIRDPIRQSRALPFVQLALVTYQANGVPGQRVSPVTHCDMFKMLGQRTLDVVRSSRNKFKVRLSGEFDQLTAKSLFPQRRVMARLLTRSTALPDEILDWVPPPGAENESIDAQEWHGVALAKVAETCRVTKLSTSLVKEFDMKCTSDGEGYVVSFDIGDLLESVTIDSDAGEQTLTLAIEEFEIFPAAEVAGDRTGDGLEFIEGHACTRRLVYSCEMDIESVH